MRFPKLNHPLNVFGCLLTDDKSLFEKKKREKSVPVKSNPIQQRERDSEELYKMKDLYRQKGAGRGSSARKLLL